MMKNNGRNNKPKDRRISGTKTGGFKKSDNKKPAGKKSDSGYYGSRSESSRFEKKPERKFEKNRSAGKFDSEFKKKPAERDVRRTVGAPQNQKFKKSGKNESKARENKIIKRKFADNNISVKNEDSGMVYGRNAVIELLRSDKTVDKLYVQNEQRMGSMTLIVAEAVKKAIPVIEADKKKLDSMVNHAAHQGVIALASEKDYCSVTDILEIAEERGEKPFILIADKIMDPHNLGAIIRTAECAGAHGIVIPKRNAVGVSPVVTKSSAGASVHMAIAKVANIASVLEELKQKGVWIFAATAEDGAGVYHEADYNLPAALVVGNEGDGLAPGIIKNSDFLVRIPMLGKIESLNVSCAASVLLYEAAKQRALHD